MIASDLLLDIYRAYRGKIDSRAPIWGSDKAIVAIDIANRKIREWGMDPRNKWDSLFEISPVATIATATFTYDLDDTFYLPSDVAKVIKTDGSYVEYPIVKAQQRDNISSQCLYIHGSDPKKITFNSDIDTGLDAGTLYIPGYYLPPEITAAGDTVPVDDPSWVVYIVASELARNDPAKEDSFPELVSMANEIYRRMSDANNDVGYGQPNSINNFMPQLGDQTESWSA